MTEEEMWAVLYVCVKPSRSNAHMHILNLRIQKKITYFWIYETLKTIVFMFYCKDVNDDMCELKTKSW